MKHEGREGSDKARRLEIVVHGERVRCALLLPDVRLGVLPDALLEKVGLALEGDHDHPVERVVRVVHLGAAERLEEAVGAELNVLAHHVRVHPDQLDGETVLHELLLDRDGVADNLVHARVGQLGDELAVEEASEVAVEPLVAADQLVREAETLGGERGEKGERRVGRRKQGASESEWGETVRVCVE